MPNVASTLCLAAKAWSDTCYLDEIQSPFRERLTMQDRHEVNKKAIEHAKQVDDLLRLPLAGPPPGPRHVMHVFLQSPGVALAAP